MSNYTTTRTTTGEPSGAAISSQSSVITITPKSGFVVSASDFTLGSLPTGLS